MKTIKTHPLYKVLTLNAFSVGLNFILGFFSVQIFARYLGAEGLALTGNFRNFLAVAKSLSRLGFENSTIKLYMDRKDDKIALASFFTTFYWVIIGSSLVLCTAIFIGSRQLSQMFFYSDQYQLVFQIFALLLPFSTIQVFIFSILNALKLFKKIIFYNIVVALITFIITITGIYFFKLKGALFALAIADVLSLILLLFFALSHRKYFQFNFQSSVDFTILKSMGKFSVMAIISAVLIPVSTLWIRSFLVSNYNIETAGIWDASERISSFYMNFFLTGIALYYMPKLAGLQGNHEFKIELIKYFKSFLPLGILILGLVYLTKNWIIGFALSKDFLSLSEYLHWQLAGDFVKLMSLAMGYQILVQTKVWQYLIVELSFTLCYLLLAFIWIPIFGIEGALKAYFFANLGSFGVLIFFFRKLLFK